MLIFGGHFSSYEKHVFFSSWDAPLFVAMRVP
jgi:hypothetical protein